VKRDKVFFSMKKTPPALTGGAPLLGVKNEISMVAAQLHDKPPIVEPVKAERFGNVRELAPLQLEKLRAIAGALYLSHPDSIGKEGDRPRAGPLVLRHCATPFILECKF
jgi:hypothetical protein